MTNLNKWALLVGIGDYPNIKIFREAVNDARLMAELLQSGYGFPAEHTFLLLDAAATRKGLLTAIEVLGERVQDDDAVVFFYSGQGSQLPDPTGRWPDGKVSTIMPNDVGADMGGQVTYDELCKWFLHRITTKPYLTLIIDTTYASSIGPCLDVDPNLRERTVFLGSCRNDERAYNTRVEGVLHGAFTYTLSQALVSAGPETTYRQVFEQVISQVSARFPQHPQMEGEGDRRLFGTGKIESMRFVSVVGRTKNIATLGAGAALGMTAGSTWAIYPPDILHVTAETSKRGLVEITKVNAVTSQATILSEGGVEAIAVGTKAIEETHHYGDMRLNVDVRVPSESLQHLSEKLYRLLTDSELISVVGPDEQANVTVWLVQPRSSVEIGDPVPQLGAVDEATWALIDSSDRMVEPTFSAESQSAVWDLRDNLEQLARNRNILNLRNPNMTSPLVGRVDFILERHLVDGTWGEAQPEAQSGIVVFEVGDEVRLVISNHHQAPLYVSSIDLPWHGSYDLIFPGRGSSEKVEPGERVYTPSWQLNIPKRFESTWTEGEMPWTWVETVKLFATTYPTDFRALVLRQEGIRGTESYIGGTTMLWELLDMALTGYGPRRSRPVQLPAEQEWITVERSFALLRKGEKTWLR